MSSDPAHDPSASVPQASLDEAIALFHRRELAQAAEHCKALLEATPDHADVLSLLGAVEGERGRFDEAVSCLQRAVALRPNHVGALINLTMALSLAARDEEAIAAVDCLLQLKPGDV
jgi:protein O-GlcNAc transferase